jgi:hypothetical protein
VIIENLIRRFEQDSSYFDWTQVPIRFRELEEWIARRKIADDDLASAQLKFAKTTERRFKDIFAQARPLFDPLFEGKKGKRPSIHDLIERFKQDDGAIWRFAERLYGKVATKPSTRDTIRTFYDLSPPFRAIILALCVAQHERCIRDTTRGDSYRAGRADLFAATYLPYCDQFISDDERQLRCLRVIAAEGGFNVRVCSYDEFRSRLVGSPTLLV